MEYKLKPKKFYTLFDFILKEYPSFLDRFEKEERLLVELFILQDKRYEDLCLIFNSNLRRIYSWVKLVLRKLIGFYIAEDKDKRELVENFLKGIKELNQVEIYLFFEYLKLGLDFDKLAKKVKMSRQKVVSLVTKVKNNIIKNKGDLNPGWSWALSFVCERAPFWKTKPLKIGDKYYDLQESRLYKCTTDKTELQDVWEDIIPRRSRRRKR